MEIKNKVETFIGFVLKTKRYKVGLNAVATLKKANLIIVCKTASDNTKKEGFAFSLKFRCPLIITEEKTLEELILKENAKIMAVCDKSLAKAIYDNKGIIFKEVRLGE